MGGDNHHHVVREFEGDIEILGDKDRGHPLHDGRAIHVDGRPQGYHEGGHLVTHADALLHRFQRDREGGAARRGGEAKEHGRSHLTEENHGKSLRCQARSTALGKGSQPSRRACGPHSRFFPLLNSERWFNPLNTIGLNAQRSS